MRNNRDINKVSGHFIFKSQSPVPAQPTKLGNRSWSSALILCTSQFYDHRYEQDRDGMTAVVLPVPWNRILRLYQGNHDPIQLFSYTLPYCIGNRV